MSRSLRRTWCSVPILLIAYSMLVPHTSLGQAWREAEEQTKRLVVMITAGVHVGAGIICGLDKDGVYIATAHHLVGHLRDTDAIAVSFYKQPGRTFPAAMLEHYDDKDLDLAVVRVRREAELEPQLLDLPFDRMADLSSIRPGSQVYLLGNPKGKTWRINIQPELLAEVRGDLLEFESRLIDGGHSGGALLNDQRHIAGMLKGSNPPYGEAVAIDRVLGQLSAWSYPVHLHGPLPKLSTGWRFTCHVTSSGEMSCWDAMGGFNPQISLETGRFLAAAAGLDHVCVIDMEGKALCAGANEGGQIGMGATSERQEILMPVLGNLTFQAISAGGWHTCGLDQDGRAYCWGAGSEGRLGNDSGASSPAPVAVAGHLRFKSIATGLRHTCGVTIDGEAYCWGGILGTGASRAGIDPPNAFVPLRLSGGRRFRSISAGGDLSCAVALNGDGYCWWSSEAANVRAPLSPTEIPIVSVAGQLSFRSISAGLGDHACGLTWSRRVYCWGGNKYGQLGDGTTTDSLMPVPVSSALLFDSISTGVAYTCGVTLDGATYCWGRRGDAAATESTAVPMKVAALDESPARSRRRPAPPAD
jgi:hypothetical protein